MENFETLKEYLNKLRKVIEYNAEFSFFGKKLIKKSRIDDIWVCVLASIPESFKTAMNFSRNSELKSVVLFKSLFIAIKGKCPLSSNLYFVQSKKAITCIDGFLANFKTDLKKIENSM